MKTVFKTIKVQCHWNNLLLDVRARGEGEKKCQEEVFFIFFMHEKSLEMSRIKPTFQD